MKALKAASVLLFACFLSGTASAGTDIAEIKETLKELREGQKQIISLVVRVARNEKDIQDIEGDIEKIDTKIIDLSSVIALFDSEKKKLNEHIVNDRQRIIDNSAKTYANLSIIISIISVLAAIGAFFRPNGQS